MTVSIIIPAYNAASFLESTVRSVVQQTYPSWECVIVDDGSSDDTHNVARMLAASDSRVRIVRQENGGVANARNRGYRESDPSSEFVIFLDHDDEWMPDCLGSLVEKLESNPGCAASHGLAVAVAADQGSDLSAGRVKHRVRKKIDARGNVVDSDLIEPTTCRMLLWDDCITTTGCVLFRRSALEQLPALFDPAMAPLDDWDLYFRLSKSAPFAFIDKVVIRWRLHEGNASHDRHAMNIATCRVRRMMLQAPDLTAGERAVVRRRFRRMYRTEFRHKAEEFARDARRNAAPRLWMDALGSYLRYLWLGVCWSEELYGQPAGRG